MSIHGNLRRLRQERGMTQEQAASQVGITRQALSSYESGRTRPDIDMLLRLSQVYQADLESLIYGESERRRQVRQLQTAAWVVLGVLLGLTVLASALRWSAQIFFPLYGGRILWTDSAAVAAHFQLVAAGELVGGILLTAALVGFLTLFVLLRRDKCRLPVGQKLIYLGILTAGLLFLPLPFALTDPVISPVNYYDAPCFAAVRMSVFFVLDQVLVWRRGKKHLVLPEKDG